MRFYFIFSCQNNGSIQKSKNRESGKTAINENSPMPWKSRLIYSFMSPVWVGWRYYSGSDFSNIEFLPVFDAWPDFYQFCLQSQITTELLSATDSRLMTVLRSESIFTFRKVDLLANATFDQKLQYKSDFNMYSVHIKLNNYLAI